MSPGFGAYSNAMTAPVSRPKKKPIAHSPYRWSRATSPPTLALPAALRDGEPDPREERGEHREEDLRVAEHTHTRPDDLAGALGDGHRGDGEEPSSSERARPSERRAERGRHSDRDQRQRYEGGWH